LAVVATKVHKYILNTSEEQSHHLLTVSVSLAAVFCRRCRYYYRYDTNYIIDEKALFCLLYLFLCVGVLNVPSVFLLFSCFPYAVKPNVPMFLSFYAPVH